jgi:hypothetical protein
MFQQVCLKNIMADILCALVRVLLRKTFWNSVPEHSVTKIPLLIGINNIFIEGNPKSLHKTNRGLTRPQPISPWHLCSHPHYAILEGEIA